jgi:hypothetical protein
MTISAALSLEDEEYISPELRGGCKLRYFVDIKKWWATADHEDFKVRNSMFHICYGVFESKPGWELELEDEFMAEFNWGYIPGTKEAVQTQSKRPGSEIKGCIAKNFSHVKSELVKQFQKTGRACSHGLYILKSRHPDDCWTKDGKYVKREKGSYNYYQHIKTELVPHSPGFDKENRVYKKNVWHSLFFFSFLSTIS